jgi:hypothetical protein
MGSAEGAGHYNYLAEIAEEFARISPDATPGIFTDMDQPLSETVELMHDQSDQGAHNE